MSAFKLLTHDFRPPLQRGAPVWDGETLPFELPKVRLDTSAAECAAGWNFTSTLDEAFKIAGLWRTGRPVTSLVVEPSADAIERGSKRRCSQLTIVRRCSEEEILEGLRELSSAFDAHADHMAESQLAWFKALGRPERDKEAVERGLKLALERRGLDWVLHEYADHAAARDAWDARDAWTAWAARDAWDAWTAWAARDAWDAWTALVVEFAALNEWIEHPPELLTDGIRDAYANGLEIAIPTDKNTLGWAMAE